MDASEWVVVGSAVAAITWVNWYFFLAERSAGVAASVAGRQEIAITVKGGYTPAELHVKQGLPLRLVFDRQETSSCSEELVMSDFGVRKYLPAFQKTAVDIVPDRPGRFGFTCGMGMLHGTLVVER